jgi:predicted kinase
MKSNKFNQYCKVWSIPAGSTSNAILYIFSGLPGTGKSTLSKIIAQKYNAVYIRIDTIEQGIRELCNFNVQGEAYSLSYKIAEDNLKIGHNVVADSCNPINLTRKEWENIAIKNNCKYINIEIMCSNENEHKKRIETRENEIEGLKLPTWEEIIKRKYDLWEDERIIIDTSNKNIEESIKELVIKIEEYQNNNK